MMTVAVNRLAPQWTWPPTNGHCGSGWDRYRLFLPKSAGRTRRAECHSESGKKISNSPLGSEEPKSATETAITQKRRRSVTDTTAQLAVSHSERAQSEAQSRMKTT